MIHKFTSLFLLTILLSLSYVHAQNVTIGLDTYGVTPYMVSLSTADIYDYTFTGLHNVGVGTKVYLLASIRGKKFGTVTYTISQKPQGSKSTIDATKDIKNDSTQVATFTPDIPGTYNIIVSDGNYTATVVINAAKYLGYTNTVVNGVDTKLSCKTCHSGIVAGFEKTHHATLFTRAMRATPGISGPTDHYSATCIKCHTTGYDANPTAKNDGFDDMTFTYPSAITPLTYDTLAVKFPDAIKRGNIQCESCHGPASGHLGVTSDERINATFSPDVCAYCHESGTNHIIARQFRAALHATATSYPTGSGREACVRCHTGKGFEQFSDGVPTTDPYFDAKYYPISCAACHDPHDATNEFQLRKATAFILAPGGTTKEVTNAGLGAVCINCHQSRAEANAALVATISSRFGPHYGTQGDILESNNMLELGGQKLASTNHIGATVDACVRCHMYNNNRIDANKNLILSGGHTFRMHTPDGVDNMEACAQCHGSTFGTSFGDVKFFFNGRGDLDNNGVVEGIQTEVRGMITKVMTQLSASIPGVVLSSEYGFYKDDGTWFGFPTPTSKWTKDQLSAYWNAFTAFEDKSSGIHNPKYIVTALRGAMTLLNIPTSVQQDFQDTVPTNYIVYQNYPNPFNPSTNIRFALPKESRVRLTVYDITGREIATLINDNLAAGVHTIEWNARDLASGIYLYRIEADNFVKVNKMILLK